MSNRRTLIAAAAVAASLSLAVACLVRAEQPTATLEPSAPAAAPHKLAPPVRQATYRNPIGVDVADPDVIRASDGNYYLYGTSAPDGYHVWSSPDLVHWTA